EDAAQHVDLVDDRVLLDVDVGLLGRLDVDALGRAVRRAEEARHAAHRAVGPRGEDVVPAIAAAVRTPLLGVVDGERALAQVLEEVANGDAEPLEDGAEVEPVADRVAVRADLVERLRQRRVGGGRRRASAVQVLRTLVAQLADRLAHRSSSPAITLRPPSAITASETVWPLMRVG